MKGVIAPKEGSEFQEYADFSIEYRDGSHRYWLIDHATEKRDAVPSVTTILNVLGKGEGLLKWMQKTGIESALTLEREGKCPASIEEAVSFVVYGPEGPDAKKEEAAARGTALHNALHVYAAEGRPPKLGEFDKPQRGYVQALCRWLIKASPEPLKMETMVAVPELGYAGRFDLLCEIKGEMVLVDLKSAKRAYESHHLQMAGYEIALRRCCEIEVARSSIVVIGEDGTYQDVQGLAEESDFMAMFMANRALTGLNARIKAAG